jgi:hypothetical protein
MALQFEAKVAVTTKAARGQGVSRVVGFAEERADMIAVGAVMTVGWR